MHWILAQDGVKYPAKLLHDKYQSVLKQSDSDKHIDVYTNLKETIFDEFLNLWDNKDGILKELSYFQYAPTIIVDTIIKFSIMPPLK